MAAADRREEIRYIVYGIRAQVDGEACPIVDISRSAVRVLRPSQVLTLEARYLLRFDMEERSEDAAFSFSVDGVIIRQTERDVVFRYRAPIARWGYIIRAMDIFAGMSVRPMF